MDFILDKQAVIYVKRWLKINGVLNENIRLKKNKWLIHTEETLKVNNNTKGKLRIWKLQKFVNIPISEPFYLQQKDGDRRAGISYEVKRGWKL